MLGLKSEIVSHLDQGCVGWALRREKRKKEKIQTLRKSSKLKEKQKQLCSSTDERS